MRKFERISFKQFKKEISDDIKAITNLNGTADFMIKLGSMEIPFQKNLSFWLMIDDER